MKFSIIKDLTSGMIEFMERKKYQKVDEMVGQALPRITTWTALTKLPPLIAHIIPEKCTGCKECVIACADGGYVAIQMRENVAVVQNDKCDGCGLCAVVCNYDAVEFMHT